MYGRSLFLLCLEIIKSIYYLYLNFRRANDCLTLFYSLQLSIFFSIFYLNQKYSCKFNNQLSLQLLRLGYRAPRCGPRFIPWLYFNEFRYKTERLYVRQILFQINKGFMQYPANANSSGGTRYRYDDSGRQQTQQFNNSSGVAPFYPNKYGSTHTQQNNWQPETFNSPTKFQEPLRMWQHKGSYIYISLYICNTYSIKYETIFQSPTKLVGDHSLMGAPKEFLIEPQQAQYSQPYIPQYKQSQIPIGHAMFYPASHQDTQQQTSYQRGNGSAKKFSSHQKQHKKQASGDFQRRPDSDSKLHMSECSDSFYPQAYTSGWNEGPKPNYIESYQPLRKTDDNNQQRSAIGVSQRVADIKFKSTTPLRNTNLGEQQNSSSSDKSNLPNSELQSPVKHEIITAITTSAPVIVRRKYEMCKNWKEKKQCRYGDKCLFAHGEHELSRKQSSSETSETKEVSQSPTKESPLQTEDKNTEEIQAFNPRPLDVQMKPDSDKENMNNIALVKAKSPSEEVKVLEIKESNTAAAIIDAPNTEQQQVNSYREQGTTGTFNTPVKPKKRQAIQSSANTRASANKSSASKRLKIFEVITSPGDTVATTIGEQSKCRNIDDSTSSSFVESDAEENRSVQQERSESFFETWTKFCTEDTNPASRTQGIYKGAKPQFVGLPNTHFYQPDTKPAAQDVSEKFTSVNQNKLEDSFNSSSDDLISMINQGLRFAIEEDKDEQDYQSIQKQKTEQDSNQFSLFSNDIFAKKSIISMHNSIIIKLLLNID